MNLLFANDRPGQFPPSWYAATAAIPPASPPLDGDARTDVCVIGGGYTGLSAALHLAQAGMGVTLIEAHRVGFGASGRNGGQVGSGQRIDQITLEKQLGRGDARRLWDLGEEAKTLVRDLIVDARIDARWTPGIAWAEETAKGTEHLHHYVEKLAHEYGYARVEPVDAAHAPEAFGSHLFKGGMIDWGAAHIHPLRYAFGLARAARANGAVVHEGTLARKVRRDGDGWAVETDHGTLRAGHVVMAGNGYLEGLNGRVARHVMPINNFIIATEPLGDLGKSLLPRGNAVADSRFVVNYWRLSEDGRLLFGGGESYGYRFPADITAVVRKPMLRIYPQLAGARIDHAWGGTLAITRSRMPFFCAPEPGLWSVSGYSGHGVAMATLAGKIAAAAIGGDAAKWDAFANIAPPAFPGGRALRSPLLALAMSWFALRDRLGI
ncbi:NAD(P)/FAD-dependent oxidoreductase [Anianabacter salinae]|uniref:NAD(P)/FAD-dependent oxidoreductase n=1 Tax=Anianabacter salinae TaxID=2851023 RepID=UPI00225DE520|nr:FAD-binding oxidoreductase [Anianabacter salinae]MBV0912581.1 FAD-binding oxidoreductase [Anianabacter salinae]